MIRYTMIVKGKVQGVGFRFFAQQQATLIGIYGTVKNLDNGDVQIEAEGSVEKLNQFTSALKKGTMFAKVKEIDAFEHQDLKNFQSFRMEY